MMRDKSSARRVFLGLRFKVRKDEAQFDSTRRESPTDRPSVPRTPEDTIEIASEPLLDAILHRQRPPE
jgi:hypothetical protein